MADGNFRFRPAGEQIPEKMPAHLFVDSADGVHCTAASNREIGHVEGFGSVARILPPQREELLEGKLEDSTSKVAEVFFQARANRSNPASTAVWVVSRFPARVAVSATGNGCSKSSMKKRARFEHHQCRVSFVQVADLEFDPARAKKR